MEKRATTWIQRFVGVMIACACFFAAWVSLIPFAYRSFIVVVWPVIPVVLVGIGALLRWDRSKGLRRWVWRICVLLTVAMLCLFLLIKGVAEIPLQQEPEIILILGCQVDPDGPSPMLQRRCDKGYELAQQYPDAVVITSGWKGPGDADVEADSMRDYLLEKGLDASRIRTEDQSQNTYQNIRNSLPLIDGRHTVIVTDDFHLMRSRLLAYRLGLQAEVAASSTSSWRGLRFWFREMPSLLLAFIQTN